MHFIKQMYPEDSKQAIYLLSLEKNIEIKNLTSGQISAALERLARDLGWVRANVDGVRHWMRECKYWEYYEAGIISPYRHRSKKHRIARMKVDPEIRKDIAQKGAKARRLKNAT